MREIHFRSVAVRLSAEAAARGRASHPPIVSEGIEAERGRAGEWRSLLAMDRPGFWLLVGTAIFIYLEVFVLLAVPISIANDQSINLDNALRMVHGQAIYKEFFQYTLPGTELFYFALFKMFGIRAWIPNGALIALAVLIAWLGMVISRRVLEGWHAYLPSLLFIYAFHFALDATHHKYSVLLVLAATATLIDKRTLGRVACAGFLLGLAACFTQSRGAVAAGVFAAFLAWEGWLRGSGVPAIAGRAATLLGAFVTVVLGVNAYFVGEIGLGRFIAYCVVFPMKYYRQDTVYNTWSGLLKVLPPLAHWYDVPRALFLFAIFLLIPAVYLMVLMISWWRRRLAMEGDNCERLALVTTAGLALYGSVIYAPEFVRLCEASLPAFILSVWLLEQLRARDVWLKAAATAMGMAMVGAMVHTQTRWHGILNTPLGRTALLKRKDYARYTWVANHTRPWEFFFEAVYSDMYFGLGLRNPAQIPYVTANGYTRPEQVRALIEALAAKRVKFVLWSKSLDPHDPPLRGDHLGPLRSYLRVKFAPVKDLGEGYIVLERRSLLKERPGAALSG